MAEKVNEGINDDPNILKLIENYKLYIALVRMQIYDSNVSLS